MFLPGQSTPGLDAFSLRSVTCRCDHQIAYHLSAASLHPGRSDTISRSVSRLTPLHIGWVAPGIRGRLRSASNQTVELSVASSSLSFAAGRLAVLVLAHVPKFSRSMDQFALTLLLFFFRSRRISELIHDLMGQS